MVKKPDFKLLAQSKDITATIKNSLQSVSFEDKEGVETDEISIVVSGLYAKPLFGDSLELYLGYTGKLYKCGAFSVQTCTRDYRANTTEIRATSINFSSPAKVKKTRTWQSTDIFKVAAQISKENSLSLKTSGKTIAVASRLQDNIADIEFLYRLCFEYGLLMAVKNNTIVITAKDGKVGEGGAGVTAKNKKLPNFSIDLNECNSLEITDANRNAYGAVALEWQDVNDGKTKSVKVGSGGQTYKMQIAQPKSDSEAFKKGEAQLNKLQKGGVNGSLTCDGADVRAGGKLKLSGVSGYEKTEFSIKSVSHTLDTSSYQISIEFEG